MRTGIMSKDESSIHDFDFELICDCFFRLERKGPGTPIDLFLAFIDLFNENLKKNNLGNKAKQMVA